MLYSLIVIMFFFQNSFSQEYAFDNFYEYKGGNSELTNFYLLNSKDDSYYLNSFNGSKLIYGKLRDTKRNTIHDYEILNQENSIRFNYQYSRKFYRDTYGNNFVVETSETKIDSTKREIKIIVFKNKRKKTIELK